MLDVAGGVAVGAVVAAALSWAFRRVHDDELTVTMSLMAGYAGYLPAEELGVSGVTAAVVVGLVIGHRVVELLQPSARLRGFAFWKVLVFLLNAVLFVLVGLQLPGVLADQDRSASLVPVARPRRWRRAGRRTRPRGAARPQGRRPLGASVVSR